MLRILQISLLSVLFLAPVIPNPTALPPAAPSPAAQLEAHYRSAHTLSVTFLEQYSESGALIRSEAGTAYFRRPGKMRWEYEKPEKNLFLVDGKSAWFYTPADRTVTKVPARDSDDFRTPLALLAGEMKLSRVCAKVTPYTLTPIAPHITTLECILKPSASSPHDPLPRVFFEITPDGELARIRIQSPGGLQTEFQFKNWSFNPPLAEELFRFSPPPGVVIVDGLLPSSPAARQ
jgi:outer membrane lipoprotein carrier protein